MKRFIYVLICFIMIFPTITSALCTGEEKDRLQKFANNITYTLEEVPVADRVYFKATFTGLTKDVSIFNPVAFRYYSYDGSNETTGEVEINGLSSGGTYMFAIYGTGNCSSEKIRTITINTPYYNKYYSDPICEKAKNYSLCQKWVQNDLNYEQFTAKVNEYIKQNTVKPNDNPVVDDDEFDFLDFYHKYYWPLLIGLMVIFIILIIIWIKQNKKNKL